MKQSLWMDNVAMRSFPALEQNLKTEVLIVGGGLAGLLCAYFLEQDGVDYALIEADRICRGVTGKTTAKITSQHGLIYGKLLRQLGPEAARLYYEANEGALADYRGLCKGLDCDFEETDNYIYATGSDQALREELAALEQLKIPGTLMTDVPLPMPVSGAIRFANQAQFHPRKLAAALATDLHIYEKTPARAFAPNRVTTDRGTITAGKIIVATHFPILNKHGGFFLKMYQQRSYVLALENAGQVDGMYLGAEENGLSFRNYRDLLLLGGGGHRTGKPGGGWKELEDFARKHYPNARERYRWATQDCMTLDGMPYIGQYSPSTPNLFVATGFNKWGMTSSMVSAGILRDLVQGRDNRYRELFNPSRTMLRPQLLKNAWSSTVNLLTPTVPRCPHLGCALKWNPQEHSWDCPCHGSRFAEDGQLLDGPATGDRKK